MHPVLASTWPVYPPAGIAPPIAGHQLLAHGKLTALIEHRDEVSESKGQQGAKERAGVVVKDGDLLTAEKSEMEMHNCECTYRYVACKHIHMASSTQPY
jgi:hypothetical protein